MDYLSSDSNALNARRFHKIVLLDEARAKALLPSSEVLYLAAPQKERLARVIESWVKEFEGGEWLEKNFLSSKTP
ncbi:MULTISPECIES: hypothetical protein [Helicobacter]|uniref:hypothetical protein n=1 Tax=Helicobacter TaxID=209 RepID=UPI0013CDFB2B|nr:MULTISPECIES: hypothetical protein [Helicobacter]